MRSERWSTGYEKEKVLKAGAAGPVLEFDNGECLSFDGEGHVMILGVSGSGKSRRGTIPMTKNFIYNKQSAIIADAKGEIYANTRDEIPDCYDVHVIDFRNLYEDDAQGWNPLASPYKLWISGSKKDRHIAEQMVEELSNTMYPETNQDPFWVEEARNVFIALVYALFIIAKPEEVNLASVYYMIAKGEKRFKGITYLKTLVNMLEEHKEEHKNVAMQLLSYITTADDTRAGIRSTFLSGLSTATKSESVRDFLSHDDLQINLLSGDKPTLVYIIIPDETSIYDRLAGILVSQLMNHYVRLAEREYSGKLPIRVNVLLEELGNIGRAITNLPHLMTAGRSRNIRVEFVLQSMSQLSDIYGTSNATTIMDNCDVRIAYRINHWDTLTEFSRICGEKEVSCDGHILREPLITQSQLAAMETGQALVIISGRVKFITWIPDFTEMYPEIKENTSKNIIKKSTRKTVEYFDIQRYIKENEEENTRNSLKECKNSSHREIPVFEECTDIRKRQKDESLDIDELIKQIESEIDEFKGEEKKD